MDGETGACLIKFHDVLLHEWRVAVEARRPWHACMVMAAALHYIFVSRIMINEGALDYREP